MNVILISHTENPDQLCANIAKVCYKSNPKDDKEFLRTILKSGHFSIIEHASFTFLIKDISRVASHQLVRHRIASYTQQSLRYTKADNIFLPESISSNPEVMSAIKSIKELYLNLIENGVKKEDARYLLPNAVTSNLIVTMNARELLHFFNLRTCVRSQKEIQDIAVEMLRLAKSVSPIIFENAGPSCMLKCPEAKPCSNIQEIRNKFKKI